MATTKLQIEPVGLAVVVTASGQPVFAIDDGGRVLAPQAMTERAAVAAALSGASAALAALPVRSPLDDLCEALTSGLGAIGTPDALDLMGEVGDRVRDLASLVKAATAMIATQMPTRQ